ncbi:uncharacterized protein CTRU02_213879 [Colletotrichum truncatum]|uniref:Uncharacterized protein n=1 Tax=Colletotrichum truncatum TaxID=5467 RepID=A0ACC3YGX3_COLTU|nr:uncharacterized protein CTRU02_12900 [Colletotrichum truncatum]KAF6784133.1 hypothetical protein CTRU02_12900 [Colletotrichum truncatum]
MKKYWDVISSKFVFRRLSSVKALDQSSSNDDNDEQLEPLMDENKQLPPSSHKKPSSPRLFVFSLPLLALIFIAFIALTTIVGQVLRRTTMSGTHHDVGPKVLIKPCGSTPQEAREKGCHFDVISFCWLPTQCYDSDLSRDFDLQNHLEWFLDPHRTQPLTHEQIMTGEYTGLYVNWEYHVRHCTAMWKKMHRAILHGDGHGDKAIDGYIGAYEHTKHCEHMLLAGRNIAPDIINTRIAVKYPDCGI